MKKTKLVYSTDPGLNMKCGHCGNLVDECTCRVEESVNLSTFTANIRIEKAGRKGKTVTIIERLITNKDFLKELTKKLKTGCGSGGTFKVESKGGQVEIQGDKRDRIRQLLIKEGANILSREKVFLFCMRQWYLLECGNVVC